MQTWLKNLKGMWVAALAEGRILGSLQALHLDPRSKKVLGFVIAGANPLSGGELWVDIAQVRKIGEDLIFIAAADAARTTPAPGQRAQDLLGRPVAAQDGQVLGTVTDVEIDIDAWQVCGLGLGGGKAVSLDADRTVLGTDVVLVQAGAATRAHNAAPGRKGLFASIFKEEYLQQASNSIKRFLKGTEANLPKAPDPRSVQNGHGPKSET